jgi:hypothetical protein
MADLSITAASVAPGSGAQIDQGIAGAAITAGQALYKEAATGLYKLADCNSATAEVRVATGIAMNSAASGQTVGVLTSGTYTVGATVTNGTAYFLSGTAGGIRPAADNTTGDYPCFLGLAVSASAMKFSPVSSGVVI